MKIFYKLIIIVLFSQIDNFANIGKFNSKERKLLYFGDSVSYYLNNKINLYPYDDGRNGLSYKYKSNFYLYLSSNESYYSLYLFYDASFSDKVFSNSTYIYQFDDTLKIPILTDFDIKFDSIYGEIHQKDKIITFIHDKPIVFDEKGKIIRK